LVGCTDWHRVVTVLTQFRASFVTLRLAQFGHKDAGRREVGDVRAGVADVLRSRVMGEDVSVRELRNHTAEVLRRVERGERLVVTVDRRPVAELVPLPSRTTWVPRTRVVASLTQADAALGDELRDVLPDTIDEL
jgi:prevent-host-death family protein